MAKMRTCVSVHMSHGMDKGSTTGGTGITTLYYKIQVIDNWGCVTSLRRETLSCEHSLHYVITSAAWPFGRGWHLSCAWCNTLHLAHVSHHGQEEKQQIAATE
jgi:hypothetical protein